MPQVDSICYQVKPTEPGMNYIFVNYWSNGSHRPSPTSYATAQTRNTLENNVLLKLA